MTRRITAVSPGVYRASVDLPGMTAVVSPSILSFTKAGETKTFTVKLTQDTATSNQPTTGWLTWSGAGKSVRSPIVVTPTSTLAPTEVKGSGAAGSISYTATSGFAGSPLGAYGVVSAPAVPGEVVAGAPDAELPDYPVTATRDTKAIQWHVKTKDPNGSIWMVLYKVVDGRILLQSFQGDGSNQATASVAAPTPGVWGVLTITLSNPPGADTTEYDIQTNVVSSTDRGGLQVTPATAPVANAPYQVTASWSGLDPAKHYTGYVEYPNGVGTVVAIN
nr:hypothetical protein [Kribbella amoyensis]